MSGGNPVEQIDAVDAFARTLFLRAKQSGLPSTSGLDSDIANAVRQLHLALRHLRIEAADPDSLLNGPDATVYTRQLQPFIEDAGYALRQLDATLDRYVEDTNTDSIEQRLSAIRGGLAAEKAKIDMFLDAVQLHNRGNQPEPAPGIVDGTMQTGLEAIKDQVDTIANRLFSRRDVSSFGDDEDRLWREFKSELEQQGFSPQVLQKHKDILRAYIRELESMSYQNGGAPPTVRGLLEQESRLIPASPKEMVYPAIDNEKCLSSMKEERRLPDSAPLAPTSLPPQYITSAPQQTYSSDGGSSDCGDSMALISTRDLINMDHLNMSMAAMQLQSFEQQYSVSPAFASQRYLPSNVHGMLPSNELEPVAPHSQALSTSPRSMPPLPPYLSPGQPPPPYLSPRSSARLAPDAQGRDIPLEAQWTKIKRTLVSPEVLERAGVRYEARPDYVAVLGRLSREQIGEYARQSAECRAARDRQPSKAKKFDRYERDRADSKSSRDDDSELYDESDTTSFDDDKTSEKGHKSYPYIVSPPEKEKTSPTSNTQPKSILKNKNEHHVRFEPDPHEVDSKRPARDRSDRGDRDRRNDRSRRSRDHRDSRDDRREGGERHSGERERERYRNWDDSYQRSNYRGDRDRGERDRRGDKPKKRWGEAIGAAGIGGAAVSLLSVLAEAASAAV